MYLVEFIKLLIQHIRIIRVINKVCNHEDLLDTLGRTIGSEFRKDSIGRIYSVVNPVIKDGQFDPGQALEYTEAGLSNEVYIRSWFFERLAILDNFIQLNNLFDLLTYRIRKLDDYANHLIILYPITTDPLKRSALRGAIELTILTILLISILLWMF